MDINTRKSQQTKLSTSNTQHTSKTARIAVIFPGQGSQSVGMLNELSEQYSEVKTTFDEASDALSFDLWQICQDETCLNKTQYTQPALLTASMAIWRILQGHVFSKQGVHQPYYLAGHSLGEYSALCASGVIGLADAVTLVHKRGQLMQDAVIGQDVLMAAVLGVEDEKVIHLCEQVRGYTPEAVVDAANFNSPGQVVVAGNKIGVEAVINQVKNNMGKKALPLKVSVPSHCQLMNPASESFAEVLQDISLNTPSIPVIQNRHAKVESNTAKISEALVEQLNNPVLWTQTMQQLFEKQIDVMIECGNGNVLSNLAKRQENPIVSYPTDKLARIETLIANIV